ncbi:uncharacterized protein (DUF427 family) [Haloactinospora alba]|uniref:Uncharacterized protein (DUF427 family) n=1 Tax=Haloactinospora alba TaxID=405555 RepID=A0A543NKF0_9ACTN|nr:DUF427 domain-containing protein [Haloactinospora alba]TQN32335.1 uncharacterized protein (DUF427 family) [Haloactinospora alba]
MSLTLGGGPLADDSPGTANYTITSPGRALYANTFPRRVRAELGGRTVLDSRNGVLLHETGLLPVLYVPEGDIDPSVLTASEHTTHCPYKGDAVYWHMTSGGRSVRNAVWAYPSPTPEAAWLRGLRSLYWGAADAWFDEGERVHGHLRDPFHRVDARPSTTLVRVAYGDEVIALSANPMVLSETGLPNRYYLPPGDVRREFLEPSRTKRYCPYKGPASYWNLRVGHDELADVAWCYSDPLKDGQDVRDHFCFLHDGLSITEQRQ